MEELLIWLISYSIVSKIQSFTKQKKDRKLEVSSELIYQRFFFLSAWSAEMSSRTSDLVGRVHPAQKFDVDTLLRYVSTNVVGFPVSVSRFTVSQVWILLFFFF